MAATLKKAATKPAKPAVKIKDEVEIKVERMIELHKVLSPFAPLVKEFEGISKFLRDKAKEKPGGEPVVFSSETGAFMLEPCKSERRVTNKKRAYELLTKAAGSMDKAIELADFKLGDLDKYLSLTELNECVDMTQTGPRTGKVVPKE